MNTNIRKLTTSAICLALCMVLPFITGQIPQIGSALSPMHIPVLLCGFVCGPLYGGIVGFIAPLLRYALFGIPVILPGGTAMAFELCTYGMVSGILYRLFPKKNFYIYVSLIISMVCGRVIWGIARLVIAGLQGKSFTTAMFIAGALTNAIPGIILHIALIPVLVMALKKANLINR